MICGQMSGSETTGEKNLPLGNRRVEGNLPKTSVLQRDSGEALGLSGSLDMRSDIVQHCHVVAGKASLLLGHAIGVKHVRTYKPVLPLCPHLRGLLKGNSFSFSLSTARRRWVSC